MTSRLPFDGTNALGQRVTKTSTGTSAPGTRLYALDETGRPLGDWINNDQVRKLLAGDSYRKIGGGPYNGTTYSYKGNKITLGDIVIYTLKGNPIHSGIYIGDGMINQKGGVSCSIPSQRTISNGWNWNGKSGPDYQLEVWRKP